MRTEEAVLRLRADPAYASLVRDTYLDADVNAAAARFGASGEWLAVAALLGQQIRNASVVDIGAGSGMASRAFALAGAAEVFAIEPDPSDQIGRGAIERVCAGLSVRAIDGMGEALPLADASVDIVYARQVLHHTQNLQLAVSECARVLKPGGFFLACREHVADNAEELRMFLGQHPVHQMTGGEHAFTLFEYRAAIEKAKLRIIREFGPWDSVINAFPAVNSDSELSELPARIAGKKLGWLGRVAARAPLLGSFVRYRVLRPRPGRLYSFLTEKP